MTLILNILSALFALLAAVFWFRAARAQVIDNSKAEGTSTLAGGEIYYGQVAIGETARRQSKFNSRGAAAAAIAAIIQACLAGINVIALWQ